MRKLSKVSALFMTGVLLASMTGCGSSTKDDSTSASTDTKTSSESKSDSADTSSSSDESDRTQLIVGFDAEYPPYGYMDDNGDYVGFDLDLAKEVCDRNGWELVKQPIDWDSKDMELNSGSIDCIWNGFTYTGRREVFPSLNPIAYCSVEIGSSKILNSSPLEPT